MKRTDEADPGAVELMTMGVLKVKDPYFPDQVKSWNDRLDPLFKKRVADLPRAYVSCDELDDLGILSEILSPQMRALLRELLPDAVIYHCLSSEIPSGQRDPHVSANDPGGWHRDSDALGPLDPLEPHYLSLMIYLTDVPSQGFGAFEAAIYGGSIDGARLPSEIVLGSAGTTWWFNRSSLHRVAPNSSSCRRRLLKLSFQHASAPNHHVNEPEFRAVRDAAKERGDDFIAALFSSRSHATSTESLLPHVAAELPSLEPGCPNSTLRVRWRDQVRAMRTRSKADRWGLYSTQRLSRKVVRRVRQLPTTAKSRVRHK